LPVYDRRRTGVVRRLATIWRLLLLTARRRTGGGETHRARPKIIQQRAGELGWSRRHVVATGNGSARLLCVPRQPARPLALPRDSPANLGIARRDRPPARLCAGNSGTPRPALPLRLPSSRNLSRRNGGPIAKPVDVAAGWRLRVCLTRTVTIR